MKIYFLIFIYDTSLFDVIIYIFQLTGSAGAMVESSDTAWYNALHKAKGALDELNRLRQQCVSISLPSGSDTSSNRLMVLKTKYQSLVTEVKQLQNILSYISWIVRVQEIRYLSLLP